MVFLKVLFTASNNSVPVASISRPGLPSSDKANNCEQDLFKIVDGSESE